MSTRILIIEDNMALREMMRRRLERRGFEVSLVNDGEAGLAAIPGLRPDIILLDMSLPGKDGWSIAQEIKAQPAAEGLPIIAITAHAMRGDREKALEAGCDDYVSKPLDFRILTERITALTRG